MSGHIVMRGCGDIEVHLPDRDPLVIDTFTLATEVSHDGAKFLCYVPETVNLDRALEQIKALRDAVMPEGRLVLGNECIEIRERTFGLTTWGGRRL